jgi:aspartyl-tRNA(Asn)/glutamyl-tRNA(Gln) amidotransferase subunit A
VSVTKLNGVTHNPWQHGRTVGGSSGGSSPRSPAGLVTSPPADGGGSIRIPAGYTGLFGMKGTYGRIPRGRRAAVSRPNTAVQGCLARSVRDAARYFDVCAGPTRSIR